MQWTPRMWAGRLSGRIDVPNLGMPAALAKLKDALGQGSASSSQDVTAGKHAGRAFAMRLCVYL
jgi:hypothetical protein